LAVVVGLLLLPIIITSAVTAGTTTGIGSFAGVAALIALVPLAFVILIVWHEFKRISGN
jgi:hypothetical protein